MKRLDREFILKVEKNKNGNKQNAVKVNSSRDVIQYAKNMYNDDILIYESFFAIFLNKANNTIGYAKIGQGGTESCIVDYKIICKYAIDTLASSVILVHNHPSGNLMPSTPDYNVNKRAKECLNFFNIKLLDSIILTEDGYFSFSDEGRLPI